MLSYSRNGCSTAAGTPGQSVPDSVLNRGQILHLDTVRKQHPTIPPHDKKTVWAATRPGKKARVGEKKWAKGVWGIVPLFLLYEKKHYTGYFSDLEGKLIFF